MRREDREQLADGFQRMLDDLEAAALRIGDVLVGAGADDKLALVGLADIGVDRVRHHHAGEAGLHRLGDQRLQRHAFQRHAQARHLHDHAGMPGRDDADPLGADEAPGGLDPGDAVTLAADARDLAVLDHVHAQAIGRTGVAPGHGVVPGRAAAALEGGTQHRVAHLRPQRERRAEGLGLLGTQPVIVDAVQPVGVDVALCTLHVVHGVRQHHHAARAEHDIVVEVVRQPFPELQRVVVEGGTLVVEIVRAADGGVAPGIAAAEPALLQHGHVGDLVDLRQVVGGGEPMAARTDDDDVVGGPWLRAPPRGLPLLVPAERVPGQGEDRIALHAFPCPTPLT